MNKLNLIIFAVVGAILIVGGVAYLASDDNESTEVSQSTTPTRSSVSNESSSSNQSIGQYISYYDGVIQETEGNKILFFHADWCVQCRRLEDDMKTNGIPDNTTVIEVDYDNSDDLRNKYDVNQQTHLVLVDDQGNELADYNAYSTPNFQEVLDNLL